MKGKWRKKCLTIFYYYDYCNCIPRWKGSDTAREPVKRHHLREGLLYFVGQTCASNCEDRNFVLQSLHNKLQTEKSRLAVAVQACEAAAACISRPSSPQDTLPPPVPDKELIVRARLEDLIDQVLLWVSTCIFFTILVLTSNYCCILTGNSMKSSYYDLY